ncbi:MAG: amino acid permease [Thiomicrospira sp.]|nr:MAG: amino acid permease [Thiomicrospira sp.]
MTQSKTKLGFNGTWSMAVGGMIGGGIFSTLGVVVAIAGAWAWLSFLAAGLIALAAGYSYVKLATFYDEGGGVFTFLRKVDAEGLAGSLAWILIIGYVLTNAVYAFTFGQYLGNLLDLNSWFPRASAVAIIALFIALNLKGVAEASGVEIFLVWFKLVVLVGLSAWGLSYWDIPMLSQGVSVPDAGLAAALFGAAAVFMAYEGFQLLTYDYNDIEAPKKTLPRAVLSAIITVILVYILVTLGTAMLIGADEIVKHEEVALAIAGEKAFGITGLVVVTIAAAFSTGSAINATLFATARLAHKVAEAHELPAAISHTNSVGIPDRAVIWLGSIAALLAAIGNLTSLVEAASLAFLFTFTVVCGLAFKQKAGYRWITGFGALSASAASIALIVQLTQTDLSALLFLTALIAVSVFGRPAILRYLKNSHF